MILNKIYAILGSLLFLDLIVLVDVIFNLSIFNDPYTWTDMGFH